MARLYKGFVMQKNIFLVKKQKTIVPKDDFCLFLHRKTNLVQKMQNKEEHGTKKSILDVARA